MENQYLYWKEYYFNKWLQQYDNILSTPIQANNPSIYSHEELLISKRLYNILLDYFKSESAIRTVWFHGSKVQGLSNPHSDLDLIIDCDISYSQKITESMNELIIPYCLDITYLHDNKKTKMLSYAAYYGSKKIYNATDFQIYWTKSNNHDLYKFKFDIKQIIH